MLLIKTVALLCSATAAMAASAVISGAIFVGEDTTDYSADPAEIFRDPSNHAAAAASILVYSAKTTDFSPATQEPKSLGRSLDAFVQKAATFPGFVVIQASDRSLTLNGSLTQFEKAIREQLDDPLTARAFRDLIPGYIQDQSLTDWILSLIVVTKPEYSDTVNIRLARVALTIESEGQTAYIPEQQAQLIVADHQVNAGILLANADMFANRIAIVSVRDFIDYFASPKVPSQNGEAQHSSTSCSKNRPIFKNQPIFRHRQTIMSWLL
ncbi:hypothetical protein BG015_004737 [Linnemannia schmuckeri]|uniref:Uncharacterized protein n=1 Tax=Linnemannia schmuckeri TaxID=64567 RepID=A0A9P5RBJ8_9FUNG|nr:hypothetical protein BG015_004737 [Linnemannia schmuckeri]